MVVIPMIEPDVGDSLVAYQIFHIVIGIIGGILVFVSTFFVKENNYIQKEEQPPFLEAIKISLKNKSFVIFEVLSFTVIYVQTALFIGLNLYMDEIEINWMPLVLAMLVSTILTLIFLIKSHEKLGVKKCMQYCLLAITIGCFLLVFFGRIFITAFIAFFLLGVGVAAGFYLLQIQFGDVMDADEIDTGLRREGIYAGVNSLITKPAISLANAVILWIIGLYGYNSDLKAGEQDPSVEPGILIAWMLIPGILLAISTLVMRWYPLAGPEWRKKKKELTLIHKEKELKLLEEHGFQYVE